MKPDRKQVRRAPSRRSRGFATVVALGLIGVLAVTLGALTASFAGDVRRSVRQAEDAQLRQLLLAGEVAVRTTLVGDAAPSGKVELPPDLASAGVTLTYEQISKDAAAAQVRVTATTAGGRSASQTLTYARVDGRFELRRSDL